MQYSKKNIPIIRVLRLQYIYLTLHTFSISPQTFQANFFIAPNLIMSSNQSLVLINGLKPRSKKWSTQVKVIHSWRQTPPYADETLELVLADQTVSSAETVLDALYTLLYI